MDADQICVYARRSAAFLCVLTTSAVEQPMMRKPPMISPQRMLLSSMKELSTSEMICDERYP